MDSCPYPNDLVSKIQPSFPFQIIYLTTHSLVEMMIGVICTCMPALSQTMRQHLPPYETLKSRLYSSFRMAERSLSKGKVGSSAYMRQSSTRSKDHYVVSEDGLVGNTDGNNASEYEMGNVKLVHTFIGSGKKHRTNENGIHMKQEIQQETGPMVGKQCGSGRIWEVHKVIVGTEMV